MRRARLTILALSAVALSAAAGAACAETATQSASPNLILAANDFSTPTYGPSALTTRNTLEWDSRKGKWGLKLGVEQHQDSLGEWRDVQPGLYYKLTPRLHIGGAVSLAPTPQINPHLAEPTPAVPRVRLETTFKF